MYFRLSLLAVVVGLVNPPSLRAQVAFLMRDPGNPTAQTVDVGINQVLTVQAAIRIPAGESGIYGFQMAMTFDPTVLELQSATWKGTALDSASLRNSQGPEFFSLRELAGAEAGGATLGVVFETSQPATFVLGSGDHAVAALSLKALQLTGDGTTAVGFSTTALDAGKVVNVVSGVTEDDRRFPTLQGINVKVGSEPAYAIAFEAATATVNVNEEITVPVFLHNNPREVDGFSFGVKHDAAVIDLVDVALAEGITAVVTPGESFFSLNKAPALGTGFTIALILSTENALRVLDPTKSPHKILNVKYRAKATAGTSKIEVSGDLGSPRVEVILDLGGSAQRPQLPQNNPPPVAISVEVKTVGGGDQRFLRGDADQSGGLTLTDAIGVLGYLFSGDTLGAAFRVTADNCLVAFNVNGDTDPNGDEAEAKIEVGDAIALLGYLFLGAAPPPAPFGDGKGCESAALKTTERMRCKSFSCQ